MLRSGRLCPYSPIVRQLKTFLSTNTLAYFAPFATADENNYPNIDHGQNKFVEGSSEKVNKAFLK